MSTKKKIKEIVSSKTQEYYFKNKMQTNRMYKNRYHQPIKLKKAKINPFNGA